MTKSQLLVQTLYFQSIISNFANNNLQLQSVLIYLKFVHPCLLLYQLAVFNTFFERFDLVVVPTNRILVESVTQLLNLWCKCSTVYINTSSSSSFYLMSTLGVNFPKSWFAFEIYLKWKNRNTHHSEQKCLVKSSIIFTYRVLKKFNL